MIVTKILYKKFKIKLNQFKHKQKRNKKLLKKFLKKNLIKFVK